MPRFSLPLVMLMTVNLYAQMPAVKPHVHNEGKKSQSSDTALIRAWLTKANYYYKAINYGNGKADSAFYYAVKSKKRSNELRYFSGIQEALAVEARIYHKLSIYQIEAGDDTSMVRTIDSFEKAAINLVDAYHNKTAKANVLMSLASAYEWRIEPAEQQCALYKQAADLYRDQKHLKHEAIAQMRMGITQVYTGKIEEAEENLNKSIKVLAPQGYNGIHLGFSALSYVYVSKGMFSKGLEYGLKAIRVAGSIGDNSREMVEVYKNLGYCYEASNDKPAALIYYHKALNIARQSGTAGDIYSTSGQAARMLGEINPDSSIQFLRRILKEYPLKSNERNISSVYIQLLHCYIKKKDLPSAQKYAEKLLTVADKMLKIPLEKSYILSVVADYYLSSKQYSKALEILPACEAIEKAENQIPALSSIYLRLYTANYGLGNYKTALDYFRLYHKIRDSLQSTESSRQMAELKLGFETEQQKKDILLLQKENKLKSAEVNRFSTERNLVIALSVLLLIIFCLLYYQFQLKKVANRKVQVKNQILEKILREKEWLLKEVHHRVKNNLQIVVSLLESQAAKLDDDALDAIHESQHRVFAISLIHKKLYEGQDIKTVDIASYIPELVGYINDMIQGSKRPSFHYQISDIHLDVSQAVPLGLIVNEAVTNSIKYAFSEISSGNNIIRISMEYIEDGKIELIISDNGTGLPTNLLRGGGEGLGLRLLFGLTEDLNGNLLISNEKGTSIKIVFPIFETFAQEQTNTNPFGRSPFP